MATSVLELLRAGGKLKPVAAAELHYPEEGAGNLARVEEKHFWFVARRELVLRCIRKFLGESARGARGIDVGCGTGYTCVYLTELGYPTVGVDAYDGFAPYKNAGRGGGFLQGDIFSIEPEPEFDFVLALDVLEHIEEDGRFLAQCLKFARPGGIVIATVPAFGVLWSEVDTHAGHRRRYTRAMMSRLAAAAAPAATMEWQSYFYLGLLPAYAASRLLHFSKRGSRLRLRETIRSEAEVSPALNRVALEWLRAESRFLPPLSLPVGSSLFSVIRKP